MEPACPLSSGDGENGTRQRVLLTTIEGEDLVQEEALAAAMGILVGLLAVGSAWAGSVYVRPHFRRDGTYVPPHYRSYPDGNRSNNWSCCGNTNPFTGERGYGRPRLYDGFGPSYPSPFYPRIQKSPWGL